MKRSPVVAGQFYPDHPQELRRMIEDFPAPSGTGVSAIGLISPHAGYIYSGAIAGRTFACVRAPDVVLLLGPNHQAIGDPAALYPAGSWTTPLGEVSIDAELVEEIRHACREVSIDASAHRYEHSLEVQVPFIQIGFPGAAIVPLCLGHAPLEMLFRLGASLGSILAGYPKKVLMVASSDMTHYESGETAREKDFRALVPILRIDPGELYRTVQVERISMCGVLPVVVMLAAARRLGASSAQLVQYGNSGDITGDQSRVVGYAGVVIA